MITSAKLYFSELLSSPRKAELLKPAVMFAVNFIVWIVVVEILKNALIAADPSKMVSLTFASVINGFTFGTVMPPFMYLLESANNVKNGKHQNNLKLMATVMTAVMFVSALAMVALYPTAASTGGVSITPLVIGITIGMATMLAMTVVERRITKDKAATL